MSPSQAGKDLKSKELLYFFSFFLVRYLGLDSDLTSIVSVLVYLLLFCASEYPICMSLILSVYLAPLPNTVV